MKIVKLETFLTNGGLRNYLFVRLTTDTGLTGLGEASLEWQEKTVETLIHEWVEDRILGADPRDVEKIVSELIRDQYQGGSTVMTAISGAEVALWDLIGKEWRSRSTSCSAGARGSGCRLTPTAGTAMRGRRPSMPNVAEVVAARLPCAEVRSLRRGVATVGAGRNGDGRRCAWRRSARQSAPTWRFSSKFTGGSRARRP